LDGLGEVVAKEGSDLVGEVELFLDLGLISLVALQVEF
jgi:hypothetical protein